MTDKVNEVVKTDNALSSMVAIDNFVKLIIIYNNLI